MSLPLPSAASFAVDFAGWTARHDWLEAMKGCRQDPVHHAEGDVWIHTGIVCAALAENQRWRKLPEAARRRVFHAALLHDVGKPACTRVEADGKISSRGHSERGANLARQLLWRQGVAFAEREAICAAIRFHQVPFFLVDREDSQRRLFEVSQSVSCDELAMVTWADATGRTCATQATLLERIALFREYAAEQECLEGPRAFASDHGRFEFFRTPGRDPLHRPHEDFRCEVVLMCGLPGAGKSTWLSKNLPSWPQVSLDGLREELDVGPDEPQGLVVSRARERAREHLRAGRNFAWNATNLSRSIRSQCIDLFAEYGARVRVVYVEASPKVLDRQNRAREAKVPEAVMRRMFGRWSVPDRTEAHSVEVVLE